MYTYIHIYMSITICVDTYICICTCIYMYMGKALKHDCNGSVCFLGETCNLDASHTFRSYVVSVAP